MPTLKRPRHGSLQFWPRKRVRKALPSVNWSTIQTKEEGILGFIAYKVGMATAIVKDNTDKSMTKGRKVTKPVTILEAPNIKVYSIRFYKNGQVMNELVVSRDKELKRILKVPKEIGKADDLDKVKDYDDLRVIVYSLPKQAEIKKTPDIIEVAVNAKDKLNYVKGLIGKEISIKDVLKWGLVDVRGLTKGKGLEGAVPRFHIELKQHKSEKGVRRPGSLGPWHPARVTFRTPMAGQLGMFTRVHYNLVVLGKESIKDKDINKKGGFKHYGKIETNYIILLGSVQGPQKRQILLTPAFRPTKDQAKKKFELLEVVN